LNFPNTFRILSELSELSERKILLNVNKIFVSPFCTPYPARERKKGKRKKFKNKKNK
jgi:hypothetical protein